jgi:hypothetical protein
VRIAEAFRLGTNPFSSFLFVGKIRKGDIGRAVSDCLKIRIILLFPAIAEFLGNSATAFGKTGIAYFSSFGQYLAAGRTDSFRNIGTGSLGDALIPLAMIIGAYIEDGVFFAVVPSQVLILGLDE